MKVLMINGSPHAKGCTYRALSEIAVELDRSGIDSELYQIGTNPVAACIACGKCSSGVCIFDDGVNRLLERADEFDALIVGSPVYYGGASGQVCSFLDRLFYASAGRFRGKPAAAVVSCRRGGATAAFERLNMYFLMNNMPLVPSQYWNQVHGSKPEDVEKDEEGLQTMRTLAKNLVWMLNGLGSVEPPKYEKRTSTNFIR